MNYTEERKVNMKKHIVKLLTIVVFCVAILFSSKETQAAKNTVEFINVAYDANTGNDGTGRGDAALVYFKDNYFLIDAGCGCNFGASNDPLTKRLKQLENSNKYLKAIIISHNHWDHYGAVNSILNTKVVNKNTTIYYCSTYVPNKVGFQSMLNNAKSKGIKTQGIPKGSIYNANTGNKNTYDTVKNNNDALYIYGAAMSLVKNDEYWENQSSMVVQLKSDNINAIFLGDLYLRGLDAMNEQYGNLLTKPDYTVCKVGHHGIRGTDISKANMDNEYKRFYSLLNAKNFVYTSTKAKAQSAKYAANHNYLNSLLCSKAGTKSWYSDDSKMPIFK